MINIEKMNKREFVLGIAIIVFCITLYTMLHPPVIKTTLNVKITPNESVYCNTSKEGKVNCYVKK